MSKKNLATTTLIAAGLFIMSVPALANDRSDHHYDRPSNATTTVSRHDQRDSPSDRRAERQEQSTKMYGGQDSTPSMKDSRSLAKSTIIPIPGNDSHNHGHN